MGRAGDIRGDHRLITRFMRSPPRREVWRVCDPPESFTSHWLWRLSRHNQREKGDLGEASPPQPPLSRNSYSNSGFSVYCERLSKGHGANGGCDFPTSRCDRRVDAGLVPTCAMPSSQRYGKMGTEGSHARLCSAGVGKRRTSLRRSPRNEPQIRVRVKYPLFIVWFCPAGAKPNDEQQKQEKYRQE